MRIGHGWDAHALVPDRPLWLGGVEVPHDRGLAGHSDGDVLLHAVASAVLGALGAGDLGSHFPSSDPGLEGVASRELLGRVRSLMDDQGFSQNAAAAAVGHGDGANEDGVRDGGRSKHGVAQSAQDKRNEGDGCKAAPAAAARASQPCPPAAPPSRASRPARGTTTARRRSWSRQPTAQTRSRRP